MENPLYFAMVMQVVEEADGKKTLLFKKALNQKDMELLMDREMFPNLHQMMDRLMEAQKQPQTSQKQGAGKTDQ